MAFSEPMTGGTQACGEERGADTRPLLAPFFSRLRYGLATRWALYTAIVGTVVTAALTSYMYQGSVDALIGGELHELAATDQAAGLRFASGVAFARADAVILARASAFAGLMRARAHGGVDSVDGFGTQQALAYLESNVRAMLEERPDYLLLRYIAADGGEVMRMQRLASGQIQMAPAATLQDLSDHPYFKEAVSLRPGQAYISDFDLLATNGRIEEPHRPVVRAAAPAFDADGHVVGVAVVDIDLDNLLDVVTQTAGQRVLYYIAGQDGDYLYQPDPSKTFGFLLGHRYRMQDDLPELAPVFADGGISFAGLVTAGTQQYVGDARRVHYDPSQPQRFVVLATLRPRFYVAEAIAILRDRTLLMAGAMLIVGTLAVAGLARRLVRPLKALTHATTRIAAGEREIGVDAAARRKDEVGDLARAIEAMAAQIRTREDESRRSADDLARTNKELTQFAYIASHDLQEPLRMVDSYLELLERRYHDRLDGDAREFIGYAVDGARRMKWLINDLLGYSRVSNRPLNLDQVDIAAVVANVVHMLGQRIAESGAEISAAVLPRVAADAVQMERLFTNLIDNAVKYRGEAPSRIRVAAERHGDMWEFSVADNGIGIEPEFRDKVFDIFARLHGRDKYPGSGIGLASCRRIVERHGGKIWIESTPGGGATFRFTLPVHMATAETGDGH